MAGLEATEAAKTWVIADGQAHAVTRRLVVGSSGRADVVLRSRGVAARHVALTPRPTGVWIDDLSGGETRVDGDPLRRGGRVADAVLQLGSRRVLLAAGVPGAPDAVRWRDMVGRAPATLQLFEQLAVAAQSDAPVWLSGATGTGKELAARALHDASARRRGPWVALNCAALPESLAEAELFGVERGAYTGAQRSRSGVFTRADGGTLLLDEVGELSPAIQAKLLRVIETGEVVPVGGDRPRRVDVRLVVATWRDLDAAAATGAFRFDLLQRLWVLKIELPPLAARRGDIVPLVQAWLAQGEAPFSVDDGMFRLLQRAPWPGNLRQLNNCVRRALALDDPTALAPQAFAHHPRRVPRRGTGQAVAGSSLIRQALITHANNRTKSARALGISRSTLYRWLRDPAGEGAHIGRVAG